MRRRILLGVTGVLAVMVSAVSLAWACVPAGTLSLNPNSGPAGSTISATASGFPEGDVKITSGTVNGPVLATGKGPQFTTQITIPAGTAPGSHTVVATWTDPMHGTHTQAPAAFTIPGGSAPPNTTPPGTSPAATTPGSTTPPSSGALPTPVRPLLPASGGKTINGSNRGETLTGTPFADVINCGGGNDGVRGLGGNDVIKCGAGNDRVNGGAGSDRVAGGSGNDTLSGAGGQRQAFRRRRQGQAVGRLGRRPAPRRSRRRQPQGKHRQGPPVRERRRTCSSAGEPTASLEAAAETASSAS